MLNSYGIPEFTKEKQFVAEELVHPFLEKPVPATIQTKKSVLITGSNASGKSTFIKSAAINAVLAQTIYTVCAKSYRASFFKVYTSMALTDNLFGNESYYIVEIKSLKRILDAAKDEVPVLCFVDEVLRGTNTVERIAASSRILHTIANSNALMFAATHDIELTYMLEECFTNYHFEEQISNDTISFDYRLKEGRATTQNAISLLGMLGYPEDIIHKSRMSASYFIENGEWQHVT
jgi:DNA mismatch repair ATPase MutS